MTKACPKCGNELTKDYVCNQCHMTVQVYKKILQVSQLLYNEGLQKANVRDLSGAIDLLQRSIKYDKNNIDARNLLGLVFFEIGEPVSALQQWVISKNLKPLNNLAETYLETVKNNQAHLAQLNSAAKNYNQAIKQVGQGNSDLGVMQLKKVLQLNPKFVKANTLLALCYMKDQQWAKAKKELMKVLAIDKSNYMARKYYEVLMDLEDGKNKTELVDASEELNIGDSDHHRNMMISQSVQQFLAVVLGVVIGVAVMAFLVMPGTFNSRDDKIDELGKEITSLKQEKTALSDHVKTLTDENTTLKADNETLKKSGNNTTAYQTQFKAIGQVLQYYLDGNTVEAVKSSLLIDEATVVDTTILNILNAVRAKIYPAAATTAFNSGSALYKNAKYEEAIVQLDLSFKLSPNEKYSDDALYYEARCQQQLGNKDKAIALFEKIVAEYPTSNMINYTKNFLKQLK